MILKGLVPDTQPDTVYPAPPHWDYGTIVDGEKIVDPILHFGCFVLGYNRHDITEHVSEQLKTIKPEIAELAFMRDNKPRLNQASVLLADKLFEMSEGYRSFYALSGSDANEGAVKLAFAYHHTKGNYNKKRIVSFEKAYHGSTLLTGSLGADNLMENPFYHMDAYQGVTRISRDFEYSSTDWDDVSCIVVESCSYGGNMDPCTTEFWNKLTHIQHEHDVILIIDDIFMGGGKTGNFIGWKNLPVTPDISTMGKAITAGTFPLSLVLYNDKIHNALPKNFNWTHGFTYTYSMPGILSALKYIDILEKESILSNHDIIKEKARAVFLKSGYQIINTFGLHFMIRNDMNDQMLYVIPLNATDEYFDVLLKNLSA